MHLCAIFNCILQPTEAAIDVISGAFVGPLMPNKQYNFVILAKTVLEVFHQKPSEAVFRQGFAITSKRK